MNLVFYSYKDLEQLTVSFALNNQKILDKSSFWELTRFIKIVTVSEINEILLSQQDDLGFDFDDAKESNKDLEVFYDISELEFNDKILKEFSDLVKNIGVEKEINLINKVKKSVDAATKKLFQKYEVILKDYGSWDPSQNLRIIDLYESLFDNKFDKLAKNKLSSISGFWELINAIYIFEVTNSIKVALGSITRSENVELFKLSFNKNSLKSDLRNFYKYTADEEIQLALSIIFTKALKQNDYLFTKKVNTLVIETDKLIKTYPNSMFWYHLLLFRLSLI